MRRISGKITFTHHESDLVLPSRAEAMAGYLQRKYFPWAAEVHITSVEIGATAAEAVTFGIVVFDASEASA